VTWLARLLVLVASFALSCASTPPPPPSAAPIPADGAKAPPSGPLVLVDPPAPGMPCFVGGLRTPLFSAQDPSLGSPSAPVTIVVFSDFQCPFCARAVETLRQIRDTYRDDNVRIVWKHEPLSFHDRARPTAEAAQVVFQLGGSRAFFAFHDEAFADQQGLTDEHFEKWAQLAGVPLAAFRQALADKRFSAKIDDDIELAARVGANGTPHFYVNGVEVSGAQPFDNFKEIIDAELTATSGRPLQSCARTMANFTAPKPEPRVAKDDDDDDAKQGPFKVAIGKSPVRGPATALVTIVVFSDFQCPFCKRVEPTLDKVRETYGDQVRFVWKDQPLPFHPRAEPAAELAREALRQKGVAAFWDVHDRIFESSPKLEDEDLLAIATTAKLDVAAVKSAIEKKKHKAEIEKDQTLADDVNASGTPHFFINGRRLVGSQPFEKFKEAIDLELDRAKALVAAGTAPTAVYDKLQVDAKGPTPPEKKTVAANPKAPSRGSASAKVVVQIFSDFQCPFCKRALPALQEVEKAYGAKVRFVFRHMPLAFHKQAKLAAEAAEEVRAQKGAAAFWKMHDTMFEHQGDPEGLARPALEGYAAALGCDMTRFRKALDEHVHAAAIEAESKAATDAGINGTPSFVVNGYFISGAQPFSKFKRVVDRALAE
jgi:protein-disulfide isomerase